MSCTDTLCFVFLGGSGGGGEGDHMMEGLCEVLESTLSPQGGHRRLAEAQLDQWRTQQGKNDE